jgi:hypothetical protein
MPNIKDVMTILDINRAKSLARSWQHRIFSVFIAGYGVMATLNIKSGKNLGRSWQHRTLSMLRVMPNIRR